MVLLQADEYGNGQPGRTHAELFAATMEELDLDPAPGAYVDRVPGVTLATDNLISLFGLHRRWRGALVGHLAAFEMTSVVPMSRYAAAFRRLGVGERAAEFYDVHVEADRLHAVIAADELIGGLTGSDPEAAADLAFGAAALQTVESRLSAHLLGRWDAGRSSLLPHQPPAVDRVVRAWGPWGVERRPTARYPTLSSSPRGPLPAGARPRRDPGALQPTARS
jgi:hypothetical protein